LNLDVELPVLDLELALEFEGLILMDFGNAFSLP
jgi:hypothetical protein